MKKMDEMELTATLKAMRFGWIIVAFFLVAWGGFNYYEGLGMTLPMILFILQVNITMIIRSIYLAKMDDKSQLSLLLIISILLIVIILVGIILFFRRV